LIGYVAAEGGDQDITGGAEARLAGYAGGGGTGSRRCCLLACIARPGGMEALIVERSVYPYR